MVEPRLDWPMENAHSMSIDAAESLARDARNNGARMKRHPALKAFKRWETDQKGIARAVALIRRAMAEETSRVLLPAPEGSIREEGQPWASGEVQGWLTQIAM